MRILTSRDRKRASIRRLDQTLERLEDRRLPAAFVVNSTIDAPDANPGDGIAADAAGNTTLRAAVMEANALPLAPADVHTISIPAGIFNLTIPQGANDAATGDLDLVNTRIWITGAGGEATIIDAGDLDRVFDVRNQSFLRFEAATAQNGTADDGGGLRVDDSDAIVVNSRVVNHRAVDEYGGGNGGGIYLANESTLSIQGSLIDGNYAGTSGGGVALFDRSIAGFAHTTITNNQTAPDSGSGGGIFIDGSVSGIFLNVAHMQGNLAFNGGAIYSLGTDIPPSEESPEGSPSIAISASSLISNSANQDGGAIWTSNGRTVIANSTFGQNSATRNGGAFFTNSEEGTLEPHLIAFSTIHANTVDTGAGGGIFLSGPRQLQLNSTILSANLANGAPSNYGGLAGGLVSTGFNIDDGNTAGFTQPSDQTSTNPLLGPLTLNSRNTYHYPLLEGSPAINEGDPANAPTDDQRGELRDDGAPDVGAFEGVGATSLNFDAAVLVTAAPNPVTIGQNLTFTITVSNNGPATAPASTVTFTLPTGATFVSSTGNIAPVGGNITFNTPAFVNGGFQVFTVVVQPQSPGNAIGTATVPVSELDINGANNTDSATVTVQSPPSNGPTLEDLVRFGVHAQPTRLIVTFNQPLDPGSAENRENYRIVGAGRDGHLGTNDDLVKRPRSAVYDPETNSVELIPPHRLPLRRRFELRINGSEGGVTNPNGVLMDGDDNGTPGGDFIRRFGREILASNDLGGTVQQPATNTPASSVVDTPLGPIRFHKRAPRK